MPVIYTGTAPLTRNSTTSIALRDLTIQLRDTYSPSADKYVRVAQAFDFIQNWGNSLVQVLSANPGRQAWDVLEVVDADSGNIVTRIGSSQPTELPPGTPAGTPLSPYAGIVTTNFILCTNPDQPWTSALFYADGPKFHLPFLPGADPGVSGVIWYDPADGNRMKYHP